MSTTATPTEPTTADSAAAVTGTASDVVASAPVDSIDELREGIDSIDAQIAQLVNERTGLSRRIQAARMNAGGTRVELGRERVVIDGYRNVLGADGSVLAEAVLRVCRGAR